MKNETRFKSLNVVLGDTRVKTVFSEGEDGIWLWLEPGFTADPRGAHDIHEWKVSDVLAAYRRIEPCACEECTTALARRAQKGAVTPPAPKRKSNAPFTVGDRVTRKRDGAQGVIVEVIGREFGTRAVTVSFDGGFRQMCATYDIRRTR